MALRFHRAERADALVAGLADVLTTVPGDPFTPDVVAVPSKGVERWIAQSLSSVLGTQPGRGDGVCANVVFPSPARLVREAVAVGSGIDADDDPWAEFRLPWPLLEVIDGCATALNAPRLFGRSTITFREFFNEMRLRAFWQV